MRAKVHVIETDHMAQLVGDGGEQIDMARGAAARKRLELMAEWGERKLLRQCGRWIYEPPKSSRVRVEGDDRTICALRSPSNIAGGQVVLLHLCVLQCSQLRGSEAEAGP